jgi:hypothetical protein
MPSIRGAIAQVSPPRDAARTRLRKSCADSEICPGTRRALASGVRSKIEPWTIPFHVIMWTTLLCGLIMTLVVLLMHR